MKKDNGREPIREWIHTQSERTADKLRAVLNAEEGVELARTPEEIVLAIHNMALFKLLKSVNFPNNVLDDLTTLADTVHAYDAFADREREKFLTLCKALRHWRPHREPENEPKKCVRTRKNRNFASVAPATGKLPFEQGVNGPTGLMKSR